jgi:hypothetical protein
VNGNVLQDNGTGTFQAIQNALQWVVNNAAAFNIASVNMSLGDSGNYNSPQVRILSDELEALAAMNVIVVSSAGNDFFTHSSQQGVAYPAADAHSLAVSAVWDGNNGGSFFWSDGAIDFTTAADRITSFSNATAC